LVSFTTGLFGLDTLAPEIFCLLVSGLDSFGIFLTTVDNVVCLLATFSVTDLSHTLEDGKCCLISVTDFLDFLVSK